jgi:pyruvate formate lyase activating enzyme
VWWEERKCIRCLACRDACRYDAILAEEDRLRIDRQECVVCGDCVEACPSQAMAFTGREWTLSALVAEALKDREYYASFGGGVTASGGESLAQYAFVAELFRVLKENGIHNALDTSGMASDEAFEAVMPYTDLLLYDLKLLDPELHRRYTRQGSSIIVENLARIAEKFIRRENGGKKLWIRTPLVPGATAGIGNLTAIAHFIRERLSDVVDRWELCAFNTACVGKYRKLGISWAFEKVRLFTQHEIDEITAAVRDSGIPSEKLVVSGVIVRE